MVPGFLWIEHIGPARADRQPEIGVPCQTVKIRGQDADDRVGFALDVEGAAENGRIGIEPAIPEGLTDQGDPPLFGTILLGEEIAAQQRPYAERR